MRTTLVLFAAFFAFASNASAETLSYRVVSQSCSSSLPRACKGRTYETISFEVQSPSVVVYQKVGKNVEGGNIVMMQRSQPEDVVFSALSFSPDMKYLNFTGSHEIFSTNPGYVIHRLGITVTFYQLSETTAILQETNSFVDGTNAKKAAASTITNILNLEKL